MSSRNSTPFRTTESWCSRRENDGKRKSPTCAVPLSPGMSYENADPTRGGIMAKKILIVDDIEANSFLLESIFQGFGLEAVSARNGQEALDLARIDPPDLIISDILMPVMDGYMLCRKWKADEKLASIPFIFYTATYTESKDEKFALSLGAEAFLVKPQSASVLKEIVFGLLEGKQKAKRSRPAPLGEEMEFFRKHDEILFAKLEKKMMDLEAANRKFLVLEERYRLSFENAADVIFTIDTDLRISSITPSVEKILGYKPEEIRGRPVKDLRGILTEESFGHVLEDIHLVFNQQRVLTRLYQFVAKDGTVRYGEVNSSCLKRDGLVIGMISVARDVTERVRAEEKIVESGMKFEAQYHGIPIPTFTWQKKGEDFVLIGFNQAAKLATGGEALKYLWKNAAEMYRDRPEILKDFLRCFEERTFIKKEIRSAHFMPGKIVVETCAFVPPDLVMVHLEDITERKKAEEKLKDSEKRYRELCDFLPIPVYEMDLDSNITAANRTIFNVFGATEKDLEKGFNARRLLTPEGIEKSARNIQKLIQGEHIEGTEYTFKRLDGSVFPAIVISSVIYREGRPVGLRGAIIDITERRKSEEKLRRMNAFLDSVVENIPNMLFIKDAADLRFVRFNRAGEELLGYSQDEFLGKSDYDFFPKEQADSFTEKDREVLRKKEFVDIPEETIQTRFKGERVVHTKKVPILDANGEPEFLLGISSDITERKKAEDNLRRILGRLERAVNVTVQVMVAAVEARDPYTSGHQTRVANLARTIAMEMGLPLEKVEAVRMAASIHDIGKLHIPAEILSKPTKLSDIEYSMIKEHPRIGAEILKNVESPWPLAEIVHQHHERLNGSGYPSGLKGDQIGLEARILAVADVVEAMATHRPYRPSLGIKSALMEIENLRGIAFDADVADACLRLFREKGYQMISGNEELPERSIL